MCIFRDEANIHERLSEVHAQLAMMKRHAHHAHGEISDHDIARMSALEDRKAVLEASLKEIDDGLDG